MVSKKTTIGIAASIIVLAVVILLLFQMQKKQSFERYVVAGMDDQPNVILLIENASAIKQKVNFDISINSQRFATKSLASSGAQNYYLKLPANVYTFEVEANGKQAKEQFATTATKQQHYVVISYNNDQLTIHSSILESK
ncbi:hypothetical protein E5161_09630 [Cohnella pontilimi]|uniref:Uncharacterized protein n=1 Tax=Cohnella pontilimi TaxID=2564100 RepID=A0A4U0FBP0_9BACL|nr:hypothetical protein [Cohnella pontilimi]TJY42256.1 hypothetical protein E5161_09630 [Cohnella pontilimi]